MKWYNSDGVEQSEAWAVEKYGVQFLDAGPGKKFKLVRVHEVTDGNVNVVVNVFNEAGGPQDGQPVAQSWPTLDIPSGDLPLCKGSQSCWSVRCMVTDTNGNGVVRFTFGHTGIIGGDGGPFAYWVLSPSLKSDGLAKVGWLGGTNHHGMLHLVFRIVDDGDPDPDPDPDPEPETGQRQRVLSKAEKIADARVVENSGDVEAAGIYLGIAAAL